MSAKAVFALRTWAAILLIVASSVAMTGQELRELTPGRSLLGRFHKSACGAAEYSENTELFPQHISRITGSNIDANCLIAFNAVGSSFTAKTFFPDAPEAKRNSSCMPGTSDVVLGKGKPMLCTVICANGEPMRVCTR